MLSYESVGRLLGLTDKAREWAGYLTWDSFQGAPAGSAPEMRFDSSGASPTLLPPMPQAQDRGSAFLVDFSRDSQYGQTRTLARRTV